MIDVEMNRPETETTVVITLSEMLAKQLTALLFLINPEGISDGDGDTLEDLYYALPFAAADANVQIVRTNKNGKDKVLGCNSLRLIPAGDTSETEGSNEFED
jgi:hypothetical protein